jgi:N-acetylmuramoyl-L-alanine amidase
MSFSAACLAAEGNAKVLFTTPRAALTLLAIATLTTLAQTPAAPTPSTVPINRMTILIDPGHGGIDSGSRIGDSILEKDITLALAFKLRSLLTARGFSVVLTRDADATTPNAVGQPLTLDDRAGLANHTHAVACLLLHATGSGTGVHLYTSELDSTDAEVRPTPWLLAQSPWVDPSRQLARSLGNAVIKAGLPLVSSAASVRPLDSLTCPALVLELAPQTDDPDTIRYADYQQQVAQAIASALVFWPNQLQPPRTATPAGAQP